MPFCAPRADRTEEIVPVQNGGYRASSRLTAIAERDDHGVGRAGVGRDIDRGIGGAFAAFSGIGPQMRDQMVMCSAQSL